MPRAYEDLGLLLFQAARLKAERLLRVPLE